MADDFGFLLNAECALAHSHECIISVWRGMPDTRLVKAHFQLARRLIAERGQTAMMLVVEQNAPPPSGEARRLIENFYAELGEGLRCVAQVIEGGGFMPSAARAVVSTINLMVRKPYPVKVFVTPQPAVYWISQNLRMAPPEAVRLATNLTFAIGRTRQQYTWTPSPAPAITRRASTSLAPPR
jgi:hypothetical protein